MSYLSLRWSIICRCAVAVVAGATTSTGVAAITGGGFNGFVEYRQETDNVLAFPSEADILTYAFADAATDAATFGVTTPNSTSYNLSFANGQFQQEQHYTGAQVASLSSDYPNGVYHFNAAGGTTSGPVAFDVTMAGLYAAQPVFTGTTLADAQSKSVSAGLSVTFNGFTPPASANTSLTNFYVNDYISGDLVYSATGLIPSTTSLTIPAGTLSQYTRYQFTLGYTNVDAQSSGGLSETANFSAYTNAILTTAPEPASGVLLVSGAAVTLLRRRSRV